MEINKNSLDTICAALAYAMGIEPPALAAEKNSELAAYIDTVFGGEENGGYCYRDFADKKLRVIMLNTSEQMQ